MLVINMIPQILKQRHGKSPDGPDENNGIAGSAWAKPPPKPLTHIEM